MRKILLSFFLACSLLSTFAFSASAHAATIQQPRLSPHPYALGAIGGGCSPKQTNGTGDISLTSCISASVFVFATLLPDAYVTFNPLKNVDSCTVRIELNRADIGLLNRKDLDCTVDASIGATNVHYGPVGYTTGSSGVYYNITTVKITYTDGLITQMRMTSPDQDIVVETKKG